MPGQKFTLKFVRKAQEANSIVVLQVTCHPDVMMSIAHIRIQNMFYVSFQHLKTLNAHPTHI